MAHTCKNCGATAQNPGHLCNPVQSTLHCDYCGQHNVAPTHVCKGKLSAMKYSCSTCGRVAEAQAELCNPEEIP